MKKLYLFIAVLFLFTGIYHTQAQDDITAFRSETIQNDSHSYALYVHDKEEKLVYCFNHLLDYPVEKNRINQIKLNYQKLEGSPELFKTVSESSLTKDELYNKILNVLWNGYPHDKKYLKSQFQLTDEQFRDITQEAIWHFTDHTNPTFTNKNKENAYNTLINLPISYPKELKLDIYKPISINDTLDKDNNDPSHYQYLLSTKITIPTKKPTISTHKIIVSKINRRNQKIKGAYLQLYDTNKKLITSWISSNDEDHSITLKKGTYIIHEEKAPDNYQKNR